KVYFVFFFQAEDGIRDKLVTGVQTCALPILARSSACTECAAGPDRETAPGPARLQRATRIRTRCPPRAGCATAAGAGWPSSSSEIGRASCRERVEVWGGDR